ncbi:hypothetical protein B0H17DRAFT_1157764 [Mycena rosella]|uniref:CxC1-like cysteine cluster associated with KDZ transposases domain-containing protein n=1 Tax=Mycena rosella TaxID=1033263 RepID=A0AAD7DX77_MYCRO|nr:hypothetical protein B0H17DRAFT_1157764 [Mycena rosella]
MPATARPARSKKPRGSQGVRVPVGVVQADGSVRSELRSFLPRKREELTTSSTKESLDRTAALDSGLIPCAPWKPALAIATRVLELYRVARLRCPNLSVQGWVKTLSDIQARAFKPYQVQQFTICFDLYLEILQNVDARVQKVLGRDAPDWRLKNCCPACTYKLDGEDKLIFEMLATCDGNDSLKRVLRKEQGRWKNMSEEITARMWGIFDETGIFLSLCRHGFVLLIADMVKSGELAKYSLAISDALMDAFGEDTGLGYDIGCGFETTIKNSPLGPKAKRLNFRMLVGSFHGHAHNQMCQLRYLATYVLGLGIEDLEGCESVYHRKQAIATYAAHVDTFETYVNLSTFLVKNYEQSLAILETETSLQFAMAQAGISGKDEFVRQLEEERTYLQSLSKEPEAETQQMDYYQRLVNIEARKKKFDEVFGEGSKANGVAKRHARENYDKAHNAVQEMEEMLQIETRWTPGGEEWNAAVTLVVTRRYRLCVNKLEELVLKRLFELTKMNMSQTGYKLRKHIAKALQVRSKTIRAALARYNLMDSFFRIERAKEKIPRLNIEIRRLITYIRDERIFLLAKEAEVMETDLHMAYFIRKYCNRRGRFDDNHMTRLRVMKKKLGSRFTGTLEPGVRRTEAVELDVEDEMDVDSVIDGGRGGGGRGGDFTRTCNGVEWAD